MRVRRRSEVNTCDAICLEFAAGGELGIVPPTDPGLEMVPGLRVGDDEEGTSDGHGDFEPTEIGLL